MKKVFIISGMVFDWHIQIVVIHPNCQMDQYLQRVQHTVATQHLLVALAMIFGVPLISHVCLMGLGHGLMHIAKGKVCMVSFNRKIIYLI